MILRFLPLALVAMLVAQLGTARVGAHVEPPQSARVTARADSTAAGPSSRDSHTDQSSARPVIVNAVDTGWYSSSGFHDATLMNYVVGMIGRSMYRNFFVFSLAGISGTVTHATLQVVNPGGVGVPHTYTVYDVTTPSDSVRAGGQGRTDIYADLGTGTPYGAVALPSVTTSPVQVTLTDAGRTAVQDHLGDQLVIGGSYPAASNEILFGGSDGAIPTAVQLILYIDQPGTTVTYAADTWSRSSAQGWGAADIGGTWNRAGDLADFAAAGGAGLMHLAAPNTTRSQTLWGVQAQDVDLKVRVEPDVLPENGSAIAYLVARRTGASTDYHGRLRFSPDGRRMLVVERWLNGYNTLLSEEKALSAAAGSSQRAYWVRMQLTDVYPTTIRLKAWPVGEPEPAIWALTVHDSSSALQTAGAVGLRAYLAKPTTNAPLIFGFDDFLAIQPVVP